MTKRKYITPEVECVRFDINQGIMGTYDEESGKYDGDKLPLEPTISKVEIETFPDW